MFVCFLLWKTFAASLQVILTDSSCVSYYNFGVPMGGGGLSCADIWPHVLPVIVFDVVHSYLLFN